MKKTFGDTSDTQTYKRAKNTTVIEKQTSVTRYTASNNTDATISDNFNDETEEVRASGLQYEEKQTHVFNQTYTKQVINEVLLSKHEPTQRTVGMP